MEKYICNLCNGEKQLPPCQKCKGKVELDWVEYVVGVGDIIDFEYGYEGCMALAGAKIHVFKEFGSYQGDWWAKVSYGPFNGWVHGSYGSCSGCDSFQAEFDCTDHEHSDYKYVSAGNLSNYYDKNCEECVKLKDRLIDFGKGYLSYIYSQEEAEKEASRNIEWDDDATTMVKFIKDNSW